MIRFLRYALELTGRIRAVFLRVGKMVQKTVHVLAFDGENVTLRARGKGRALHVARGRPAQLRLCPRRPWRGLTAYRRGRTLMVQKIRQYLNTHEKQYEMISYLFAGGPDHAAEHGGALWLLLSHGR